MPSIGLTVFNGIVPRLHPTNLASGYAEIAENVRLSHGTLRPWRSLLPIANIDKDIKTIYQIGCCWFVFNKCVSIATWKPQCQRLMVTGWAPYPVMAAVGVNDSGECYAGNACCPGWTHLGVIAPTNAPSAVATMPPSYDDRKEDLKVVQYVYTYENCYCEESAPSYPSEVVQTNEGVHIVVSNLVPPPDGWCITKINIYRLESAYDTGTSKKVQSHETGYFLVGTVDATATGFVDTVEAKDVGRVLTTFENMPPPQDLQGITSIYGGTTLAGFRGGNQLWFSRHGECWNWPEAEMMALDDNIISIESDSRGILHVITDGSPYAVTADDDCNDRKCRRIVRHMEALPGVVCCSGRGSISTPIGTIYVSSYGLVLLSGESAPVIFTQPWFATEDWRKLKPETMRLGYYAGSIFCVSDVYGFVFSLDGVTHPKWDTLKLSTITDRPKTMFTNRQGELFFQLDGAISQWDAGNSYREYRWKSKQIESPTYFSGGAGRVECSGATKIKLFADGKEVYSHIAMPGKYFRPPAYGHHLFHGIELSGISEVWRVHVASSLYDLREEARDG